jgi:hypothetical protein
VAVSIVANGESSNGSSGEAATLDVTKPSGGVADNIRVAAIQASGGTAAGITAPANWNLIRRSNLSSSVALATFWYRIPASEPATHTWGFDIARQVVGGIVTVSGADVSNPLDGSAENLDASASTTIDAPTYTTQVDGCWAFRIFGVWFNSINVVNLAPPAGFTGRLERNTNMFFPRAESRTIEIHDQNAIKTPQGPVGIETATESNGLNITGAIQTVAIRPVQAPILNYSPTTIPRVLEVGSPTFVGAGSVNTIRSVDQAFTPTFTSTRFVPDKAAQVDKVGTPAFSKSSWSVGYWPI